MPRISLLPAAFIALFVLAAGAQAASTPEDLLRDVQKLLAAGSLDAAEQKLHEGAQSYPDDPRLANALGIVSAQRGDLVAAEKRFRKAVEMAPRFTDAYLNLGRLYQQAPAPLGSLEKAIGSYDAIAGFDPENVEANYQLAVLLQRQGSYQRSQTHLQRLPNQAQQRAQAISVHCANLAGLGDEAGAKQAAQKLLAAPDLSEPDITTILPVLVTAGKTEAAVLLLEGLSTKGKATPANLRQLGLLYEQRGDLDRARQILEKAAPGFKEDLTPLLVELARIAYKQKDQEGALSYLAHARDLSPNDATIHFFFGVVCMELDLIVEARNSLQKAVDLNPDQPYYNYALGAVLSTQRNAGSAAPYLQKFLAAKPEDARGRLALGVAYYRSASYDDAERELKAVADNEGTAAAANYYLGRIAMRNNAIEQAEKYFQQAVQHAPDYTDAYADLALTYIRQAKYEPARKALDQALKIDADAYRANLNLLLLYERTKDPRQVEQKEKFDRLKKEQEEKLELFTRSIEVRPY